MELTLGFYFIIMGASIYILIRNERVYRIRTRILDEMREATFTNSTYIKLKKCLDKYDEISYPKMLYSFKSIKKWDIDLRKHIGWGLRK